MPNIFKNQWISVDDQEGFFTVTNSDYVIMAVTSRDKHLLISEYRHAYQRKIFNIPCGGINQDELPEDAAKREFEEEITSFLPKDPPITLKNKPQFLLSSIVSPNRYFSKAYVFLYSFDDTFPLNRPHCWLTTKEILEAYSLDSLPGPTMTALAAISLYDKIKLVISQGKGL